MTDRSDRPKVSLSELREIGWRLWDPIGLADGQGVCPDDGCADEYDTYLLHVASMMLRAEPRRDAAAYLVRVARDWMGMSSADSMAAERTVEAIAERVGHWQGEPAE